MKKACTPSKKKWCTQEREGGRRGLKMVIYFGQGGWIKTSLWVKGKATSKYRTHWNGGLRAMVIPVTSSICPPMNQEPAALDSDDLTYPEVLCSFSLIRSNSNPLLRSKVEVSD